MKYRLLGNSDITVSEIGLGCWTLGGLNWEDGRFSSGWKPVDIDEAKAAIHYAIGHGITHFDNADVYGNGAAERLLADALGSENQSVVVSSKVGWFSGTALHAYESGHIIHQCEQSLTNLNRDYLDIYYFHHPNFGPNDCYLDEACLAMNRLKEQGKIRLIGLSAYSQRDFSRLIPKIEPTVVQSWAHCMDYHFIAPNSPLMQLCKKYTISFVAFSPLNQGLLLNKYSSSNPPSFCDGDHRSNSEKFRKENLQQAEQGIEQLNAEFGDLSQEELVRLALQYVLHHEHVAGVIPGFRDLSQVAMHCAAADRPLNGTEISAIRRAFKSQQ